MLAPYLLPRREVQVAELVEESVERILNLLASRIRQPVEVEIALLDGGVDDARIGLDLAEALPDGAPDHSSV